MITISYSPNSIEDFERAFSLVNGKATITVSAPPEKEMGPIEAEYIKEAKKQFMRMPGEWQGTREEFASKQLKAFREGKGSGQGIQTPESVSNEPEREAEIYTPNRIFTAADISDEEED